MTTAIYARVSTKGQDTDNQIDQLREVARKAGWEISETFVDHGISGAKGRNQRPGLDSLLKAVTRREITRVMVWSVDRLGRSLQDLIATLNEINDSGADLYLHQQSIDTSTPAGRALFGMLGVFAEFERSIISNRVRAGLEKAKARGQKLGRKAVAPITKTQIRELRAKGLSQTKIANRVGLSQAKVSQVLREAPS